MNREIRSDSELLQSYTAGNKTSIDTLINRHRKRIYNYIFMMVKDPATTEDILQETLIKAISNIERGKYADNGKFISWVLRIAHNMVIDHFRSGKSIKTITNDDVGYDLISHSGLAASNAEDEIISDQVAQQVRNLVDHLPTEQREVVMLRHFMDLSFKEIAEQTGVSINTALGRMRYALINLRKLINENNLSLV